MKCRARKIVACLLLGFITTLAVTFAAAKWVHVENRHDEADNPVSEGYFTDSYPTWSFSVQRVTGAFRMHAFLVESAGTDEPIEVQLIIPAEEVRPELVPAWIGLPARTPTSNECFVDARGWPFLAFWCEYVDTNRRFGEYEIEGGVDIRFPKPPPSTASGLFGGMLAPPAMPLRPIWTGLIADTLFYAALWYGLMSAPAIVRRWPRRRRGLCPACGYNLRGHGGNDARCPECGANQPHLQFTAMKSISHDRNEESLEAKARWFRTLTMEQRLAHFAEQYDLALQLNPDIVKRKDVPPPSDRVQVIELP